MQFKNSRNTNRAIVIDMTPMIDIVFQLLIFFLVTSQMAEQTRTSLELPREVGEESDEQQQAGITVNVTADGTVIVSDNVVSLEALDRLVDEAIAVAGGVDKLKPIVRADRNCDSARLNEVFNRLSARGLTSIRLATERGQ
ncbi:MAG: ExbD/TolR family protein [Phycisphaerales bacterium]